MGGSVCACARVRAGAAFSPCTQTHHLRVDGALVVGLAALWPGGRVRGERLRGRAGALKAGPVALIRVDLRTAVADPRALWSGAPELTHRAPAAAGAKYVTRCTQSARETDTWPTSGTEHPPISSDVDPKQTMCLTPPGLFLQDDGPRSRTRSSAAPGQA